MCFTKFFVKVKVLFKPILIYGLLLPLKNSLAYLRLLCSNKFWIELFGAAILNVYADICLELEVFQEIDIKYKLPNKLRLSL